MDDTNQPDRGHKSYPVDEAGRYTSHDPYFNPGNTATPPPIDSSRLTVGLILSGVACAAFLFLTTLCIFIAAVGAVRKANSLEEALKQQEQVYTDKIEQVARTIAGKYQVAGKYSDRLKEIIAVAASPRTGGALFKQVTEQNADIFPPELFRDVQQYVESGRAELHDSYRGYADLAQSLNTLIRDPLWGSKGFFGQFFMGQRKLVYPEPVISSRTAEAQKTRRTDRSDFDADFSAKP